MELEKVFPIQAIEDNIIVNGQGDLTVGFAVSFPEMFTLREEDYLGIHKSLLKIISNLPTGTVFHKQDYYYLDRFKYTIKEDITYSMKRNMAMYMGMDRPILRHHGFIFLTFSSRHNVGVDGRTTSLIAMWEWVTKKPFKDLDKLINKVKVEANNFYTSLSSVAGIDLVQLTDDTLAEAVYNYFSLSYQSPKNNVWGLQLPSVESGKGYCKIGNNFVALASLYDEGANLFKYLEKPKVGKPENYSNNVSFCDAINGSSMTYPIALGLPIDHIVNTTIEVVENEDMAAYLKSISTGLNLLTAFNMQSALDKKEEIKNYIDSTSKFHYKSCKTSVNVIVHDIDLNSLQEKIYQVNSAFSNMNGSNVQWENKHLLNCFFSCIPGNTKFVYKFIPHILDQAVCYLSCETHYRNDKNGVFFVDRFGAPVVVNLWDAKYPDGTKKIDNRNKMVYGPPGSGKSFLLNYVLDQNLFMGHHVVIIDIGKSYEKLCHLYNGLYLDSSDKNNFRFNIFACERDKEGKYIYKVKDEDGDGENDRIDFIYSVIITIWKGGGEVLQETKTILKLMIAQFYEFVNQNNIHPSLFEFNNFIPLYEKNHISDSRRKYFDFDSLQLLLEPFVTGPYSYLLNSPENISLTDSKFVVFELESIKGNKELFPVLSILICELAMDKIRRLDERVKKTFLIDEALDFLKSDMGDFIAYLFRTIRKKGGEVIIAAQSIEFLEECSEMVRKSLVIGTDTIMLLNHSKHRALYPSMKSILSLNANDLAMLDSLKGGPNYKEVLLKLGNETKIYRVEVSKFSQVLYSTTDYVVAEVKENFKKSGNMNAAVNEFLEKNYATI